MAVRNLTHVCKASRFNERPLTWTSNWVHPLIFQMLQILAVFKNPSHFLTSLYAVSPSITQSHRFAQESAYLCVRFGASSPSSLRERQCEESIGHRIHCTCTSRQSAQALFSTIESFQQAYDQFESWLLVSSVHTFQQHMSRLRPWRLKVAVSSSRRRPSKNKKIKNWKKNEMPFHIQEFTLAVFCH